MRRLAATMGAVMIAFGGAASAAAQDAGKVGITMGYPASIGVIWHISDRIALRPEISLQQISNTITSTITVTTGITQSGGVITTSTTTTATSDQWTAGYGVSALFYVRQWDALRAYVTPRFQYTHGSSSSTSNVSSVSSIPGSATEFSQNAYTVTGSFGAQYGLGSRFGLYGEVGFGYTHQTSENSFAVAGNSTGHTVATRSGAGVIFYFGN